MIPAAFEYQSPKTVDEALKAIASLGDRAKVVAGGHSLIPIMKLRLSQPEVLVDIGRIGELRYIRQDGDRIAIGALTTHAAVLDSSTIKEQCAILHDTVAEIGDQQVRNRGTIGGSLAHADPAADYPATILALDAEIVAQGPKGRRTIKASEFFTGLLSTALAPDELLVEVRVPTIGKGSGGTYLKLANKASHYAVVGVAAVVRLDGGKVASASVGITGAGSVPTRASAVEKALQGQAPSEDAIAKASESAAEGIDLLADIHGSSDYRAHIARVYTRRALAEAVRRAGG
jgi:carbon-monoxide dehydrogenase medium subunit